MMNFQRHWILRRGFALLICLFGLVGDRQAHACTVVRFNADGHLVIARNHDWPFGEGMLVSISEEFRRAEKTLGIRK